MVNNAPKTVIGDAKVGKYSEMTKGEKGVLSIEYQVQRPPGKAILLNH